MNKPSVFRFLVSGTAWSVLGVVLTVAFFYWTEYRNSYALEFTVEDDVNLVEVRERIDDLKILYKGEDILTSGKQIRMIRVSIRNAGKTILQQQYDQSRKFGLAFKNAVLLTADVEGSNSDYLRENILPRIADQSDRGANAAPQSDIELRKLIFDKGKYVVLKLYVAQQTAANHIELVPLGKVADIDQFSIQKRETVEHARGEGIALGRVLGYMGLGYVGFLVFVILVRDRIFR